LLINFVIASAAHADDEAENAGPAPTTVQQTPKVSVKKSKGGKRTREKDADGTEAPDRFEADTVIKSQYKLNGQPLEVDPD
jgi:hypothetical protein